MYHAHWGLARPPFGSQSEVPYFYRTPAVEEALARLEFLLEQHRRLGVVVSAAGGGKSVLLQALALQHRKRGQQVVSLNLTGLTGHDFVWQLAAGLNANPDEDATPFALWRQVQESLTAIRHEGRLTIALFDDADRADAEVLRAVERLVQWDPTHESQFTVILSSRPESLMLLGETLLDQVELRVELEPWNAEETAAFLATALRQAGSVRDAFHPEASRRLFELSGGVPRQVAQIADLALLAGAGHQLPHVDRATIDAVHQELVVGR